MKTAVIEDAGTDPQDEEVVIEVPPWLEFWGAAIETVLSTLYFLFISSIAVGIDLGLHWFERRPFIQFYGLSRIIQWEIELMAYTLATVDCFLFMRRLLIQPVIEFVVKALKR
jgi:hypothetical protein